MTAIRTATRIQDMDDANIAPAEGVDGYAFVYDDAQGMFILESLELDRIFRSSAPIPVYGPELLNNGAFSTGNFTDWTAGAGWSVVGSKAKHTSGSVEALSQTIVQDQSTEANRHLYKIAFTISDRTIGSISMSLAGVVVEKIGGVTVFDVNESRSTVVNVNTSTSSIVFSIIPTTDFDGSVDNISIMSCGAAAPYITTRDDSEGTFFDIFGSHNTGGVDYYNLGLGRHCLERNLGFASTAVGIAALSRSVLGGRNTAAGEAALAMLTIGSSETAVGQATLLNDVSGWRNTATGAFAATALLTGYRNSFFGAQSALNFLRGERNVIIGAYAGAVAADGSTPITKLNDSVLVGTEIRSTNDSVNEIAIGTAAIGLGSNTAVIGNSSTLKTALFGALRIPQLASAPTGEAGHALVYAIDNGSGKMKFCVKLGDDIEIILATQL